MRKAIWLLASGLALLLAACGGQGGGGPDLRLVGLSPNNPSLCPGQAVTLTLTLASQSGFQGQVTLQVTEGGQPPSWLSPTSVERTLNVPAGGQAQQTLEVAVAQDAPTGTHALKVRVTYGNRVVDGDLNLTVEACTLGFEFDHEANQAEFQRKPDVPVVRGRLTVQGVAGPPQVRLQYRFVSTDGTPEATWREGPPFALTRDPQNPGTYLAEAALEDFWPVGLDPDLLRTRARVQLRAVADGTLLAQSRYSYPVLRANPLWVKTLGEPSRFNLVDGAGGLVCAGGQSRATSPTQGLAWCLDEAGNPQALYREPAATDLRAVAVAPDGTLYTLGWDGQVRAYRNGSPTGLAFEARGIPTTLATDGQSLYVGGAVPVSYRDSGGFSCSALRFYVERFSPQGQSLKDFQGTPEQAREVDENGNCYRSGGPLNSSPNVLRVEGDTLYMYYVTRVSARQDSNQDWDGLGQLNAMRLNALSLSPVWAWKDGFDNQRSSSKGWFVYWPCNGLECDALYYTLYGFDLDPAQGWMTGSHAPILDLQTGNVMASDPSDSGRFPVFLGGNRLDLYPSTSDPTYTVLLYSILLNPGPSPLYHTVSFVLGPAGGSVEMLRRFGDQVYAVGVLGGKGFIARLR
ncbi:hypothetical protein TJA_23430 [Thermus sp. LT1-2-5]|uniref:COG1470 family protein n=1 Tax=Thermus sp. LT1-2-5 TaxID=3026935 RepID=UPI0030E97D98